MVITGKKFLETLLEIQRNPGDEAELALQLMEVAKSIKGCNGLFYISPDYSAGARIYLELRDEIHDWRLAKDVPRYPRA